MKVKVLSRNPSDYIRETKFDIMKMSRNYDPYLHPLEMQREYIRALNAVKLERVFAKPFIGGLDGHREGISCLAKHKSRLAMLLSGSYDGEIRIWDLMTLSCKKAVTGHEGFTRGVCTLLDSDNFLSCGDDKAIREWSSSSMDTNPLYSILSKTMVTGIDSSWSEPNCFVTCGEKIQIWERSRTEPLLTFSWDVDSHSCVRFNPIETYCIASCASNRCVYLYDKRQSLPLRKVTLEMCSSSVAWNPMEAFIFTVANDNHNLYTFDMRNLKFARNVHQDHVGPVMDVDFSPTGREFVSAGYDRTVRIFPVEAGHSRDVYHTKRMQRVICVKWSQDDKYIFSGSDEMNIRVWKAHSNEKLGFLSGREKDAFNYQNKLKEKFAVFPQVRRIARHRHLPKFIYNAMKQKRIVKNSQKRKEANVRSHRKPGSVPFISERKKAIVNEE